MDSLLTGSIVHAFLFHSKVCGPHVNFRGVNRAVLACNAASLCIKAHGWFVSLLYIGGLCLGVYIAFTTGL